MSRMQQTGSDSFKTTILLLAATGLVSGRAFWFSGKADIANFIWFAGVVPALAALVIEILRSIGRGEVGWDLVAALSMTAALVFGETLAAAVVAVMYSGGTFLESFAEGRARREMHDLLSRVPRTATRHRDGGLEDVPLHEIEPGDRLLIRQGDVVPVDGTVAARKRGGPIRPSRTGGTSRDEGRRRVRGSRRLAGAVGCGQCF
jgi:cation transport ATPase